MSVFSGRPTPPVDVPGTDAEPRRPDGAPVLRRRHPAPEGVVAPGRRRAAAHVVGAVRERARLPAGAAPGRVGRRGLAERELRDGPARRCVRLRRPELRGEGRPRGRGERVRAADGARPPQPDGRGGGPVRAAALPRRGLPLDGRLVGETERRAGALGPAKQFPRLEGRRFETPRGRV